jgi:signal transduction histidine kinase
VAQGRLIAAAAVLSAAAVVTEAAYPAGGLGLSALDCSVAVAFAAVAPALARPLMVCVLALGTSGAWTSATLVAAGSASPGLVDAAGLLHRAPLAALVALYPQGRRAAALVLLGAGVAASALPNGSGAWTTTALLAIGGAVALLALVRGAAVLRAARTVAVLAGATATVGAALTASGAVPPASAPAVYDALLLASGLLLAVPAGIGQWRTAAVAQVALDLGEAPAGAPVTARLAALLGDPSLRIYLLPAGAEEWVDEAGRTVAPPKPDPVGQAHAALTLPEGGRVVLAHDELAVPADLGRAAATIAATTIDNAGRDRDLAARIEALERLRAGLVRAIDEERRELQQDLRAGPLGELESVRLTLTQVSETGIGDVLEELDAAQAELLNVADGVYPSVVLREGLERAVRTAASRSGVTTTVRVSGDETLLQTLPEPVAIAAFFVTTEALTNIAKHARATAASVELLGEPLRVRIRVADDGVGGADVQSGGFVGMRDRVQALGGDLQAESEPGQGTVVEAWLPLQKPE